MCSYSHCLVTDGVMCESRDGCYVCTDLYEWCQPDKETAESGFFMIIVNAGMCAPWVAWIGGNAVVHFVWVGTLLGCQMYQVGN